MGAADVAAKTAHAVGFETAAQVLSSLGLTDAQLDAATREDANKAQLPIEVLVNVIVVVFADADGNFQPPVFVSATECDVDPTRGCEHASLVELVRICSTAHLYTVSKYVRCTLFYFRMTYSYLVLCRDDSKIFLMILNAHVFSFFILHTHTHTQVLTARYAHRAG